MAAQLVASRVVLSSTELVNMYGKDGPVFIQFTHHDLQDLLCFIVVVTKGNAMKAYGGVEV
jgi:hypothetical protein